MKTFESLLSHATRNNRKAVITVGMIKDGQASYTVYGENAAVLPQKAHIYEIGSLTKTFTASLLFKAIEEGKIGLDDSIDRFLDLPPRAYYPAIRRIVTHTAGYKGTYAERGMLSKSLRGGNGFSEVTLEKLVERAGKLGLKDRGYPFCYSNYGLSVVGAVLSRVYETDFAPLMNDYIARELALPHTAISDGSGDLGQYWDWAENGAYLPAGALTSTIEDMLEYARLHMYGTPAYLRETHKELAKIGFNAMSAANAALGARMDAIGAVWKIDERHGIVWHDGATGRYNCYLGIDPEKRLAAVVLSNLSPYSRVTSMASAMGARLLRELQEQYE